jgi:hypothetical protein
MNARAEDVVSYEFGLDWDLRFEAAADDYLIVIRHATGFLAEVIHHAFERGGGGEIFGSGPSAFGGGGGED